MDTLTKPSPDGSSPEAPGGSRSARDEASWRSAIVPVVANPYAVLTLILALVMAPAWLTTGLLVLGGDVHVIHAPGRLRLRAALAPDPIPPILAINWLVGLHVLLAGFGTAWAAGRLGATREGQILAGLAYALGSATPCRSSTGSATRR